jgi:hypothetical protein
MSDNPYPYTVRVYKGQIVEFRSSRDNLINLGFYDKKTDAEREKDTTYLPVGSILNLTLKFDYVNKRSTSGIQFVFKDKNEFSYDVLFSDFDNVVKNMSFGVIQGQFELVKKGCAYGIKFIN